MKFKWLLGLITFLIIAVISAYGDAEESDNYYDRLFLGSFDITEFLDNHRVLEGYSDCLVDKAKCTGFGKALKEILPDMVATDCRKCSWEQKRALTAAFQYLRTKKPHLFRALVRHFDPHGDYQREHKLFN